MLRSSSISFAPPLDRNIAKSLRNWYLSGGPRDVSLALTTLFHFELAACARHFTRFWITTLSACGLSARTLPTRHDIPCTSQLSGAVYSDIHELWSKPHIQATYVVLCSRPCSTHACPSHSHPRMSVSIPWQAGSFTVLQACRAVEMTTLTRKLCSLSSVA